MKPLRILQLLAIAVVSLPLTQCMKHDPLTRRDPGPDHGRVGTHAA
jgi:hypothetical protein